MPELSSEQFIAFAGFAYATENIGISEKILTLYELRDETEGFCSKSFSELLQNDTGDETYCFAAVLAYTILHNGYGISEEKSITFTNSVNEKTVDWSLGAMVYEASIIQVDLLTGSSEESESQNLKLLWILFAVVVIAIAVIVGVVFYKRSSSGDPKS